MTFYPQIGVPENAEGRRESRTFLDTKVHPDCDVLREFDAEDWRAARASVSDLEAIAF